MPPRRYSRYQGSRARLIDDPKRGEIMNMDLPEPVGYMARADTRTHQVTAGDTWTNLAARYFPSFPRPEALFWVIMDFQPVPYVDPTVPPLSASILYVPSEGFVHEWIFGVRSARTMGI